MEVTITCLFAAGRMPSRSRCHIKCGKYECHQHGTMPIVVELVMVADGCVVATATGPFTTIQNVDHGEDGLAKISYGLQHRTRSLLHRSLLADASEYRGRLNVSH